MAIGALSPVQPIHPLQGHLMSARSGVLQSQTQMKNIPCYHLISCGRWSGMYKPGDGGWRGGLQRKERMRKGWEGAGE